jgi:excisionase family DNA binding protein
MGSLVSEKVLKQRRGLTKLDKLAQSGVEPMSEAQLMAIDDDEHDGDRPSSALRRVAYTLEEAAQLLGVSVHFLRKQTQAGELKAVAVSIRLYLVTPAALQEWFTSKGGGELDFG